MCCCLQGSFQISVFGPDGVVAQVQVPLQEFWRKGIALPACDEATAAAAIAAATAPHQNANTHRSGAAAAAATSAKASVESIHDVKANGVGTHAGNTATVRLRLLHVRKRMVAQGQPAPPPVPLAHASAPPPPMPIGMHGLGGYGGQEQGVGEGGFAEEQLYEYQVSVGVWAALACW